jgi:hypothetical protein
MLNINMCRPSACVSLSQKFFSFFIFTVTVLMLTGLSATTAQAATITVAAGGNFQQALDAAQGGDEIILQAGATFTGPFTLPYKGGNSSAYITIRSSAPAASLPAAGVRMTPEYASLLPKLVSPGLGQPALRTAAGAHHYRFIAIEIAPRDEAAFVYELVTLGNYGAAQDTPEEIPHHLSFDRCYIHAFATQSLKRGVTLNSAATEVINSYVAGFKVVGQDSQAVMGWNGPGPFRIINNYLEAAGENVLFGGASVTVAGVVPSDIEVRGNHLTKPLSWREGEASYAGVRWAVKNLFELKSGRRVWVEGNVFEHSWRDGQVGFAILLTPLDQDGRSAVVGRGGRCDVDEQHRAGSGFGHSTQALPGRRCGA